MEPLTQLVRGPKSKVQGLAESAFTRRDVLRAAGALGVSFLLPALEARAAKERGKARQKSLITVFLAGGASQLATWDPHPGTKIGGPTRSIATAIRGLQIADSFPLVAAEV